MLAYSTEFPINNDVDTEKVYAVFKKWLIKSPHYPFSNFEFGPLQQNDITKHNHMGHSVMFAHVASANGASSVGIRHQHNQGEMEWVTEATTRITGNSSWVSVKIFCDTLNSGTEIPLPKKPHIVKLFISDLGGGLDNGFKIDDKPYYCVDNDIDLEKAKNIILGRASTTLPFVYISVDYMGHPVFDPKSLAYWLSGMSHVIVEPNRQFSVKLASITGSQNCYGGVACIYWPTGASKPDKIFLNKFTSFEDAQLAIVNKIKEMARYVKNKNSITWLQLKDEISESRIAKLKQEGSDNLSEFIHEFDSQNRSLREQLEEANAQIASLSASNQGLFSKLANSGSALRLKTKAESEFYPNEFVDIALSVLEKAKAVLGEKTRAMYFVDDLLRANDYTGTYERFENELKRALDNYTKFSSREKSALEALGFDVTEEGKHVKIIYNNDERFTFALPKTPSDHRGIRNTISDIMKKIFVK